MASERQQSALKRKGKEVRAAHARLRGHTGSAAPSYGSIRKVTFGVYEQASARAKRVQKVLLLPAFLGSLAHPLTHPYRHI